MSKEYVAHTLGIDYNISHMEFRNDRGIIIFYVQDESLPIVPEGGEPYLIRTTQEDDNPIPSYVQ